MADTTQIKNPSLLPGDLELRLDAQNFVTAISGYPVGGGGGTIVESDFIWKPVIDQDGTIGWERDTSATTPATADLVPHIYNDYWYVGTSNTNVEARGPQGDPGTDGISPKVRINDSTNFWEVSYDSGSTWSSTNVSATGQDGQDGDDGVSPTVSFRDITDTEHTNGGTEVTITDVNGAHTYSAWNGNDGTMAGAPGIEGNKGISAVLDSSTYKVGLSAAFYTAVTSVSSKLDESDFTTYTATTAPGAFQPKGNYLEEVATSGSIIGTGLSTNKIGLVTSAENALAAVDNKLDKTAIVTATIDSTNYVTAVNINSTNIPIKDTSFWEVTAATGTTASNNTWQHYISTTNTFNYYKMVIHPNGTSSAQEWANDGIIHIILEA